MLPTSGQYYVDIDTQLRHRSIGIKFTGKKTTAFGHKITTAVGHKITTAFGHKTTTAFGYKTTTAFGHNKRPHTTTWPFLPFRAKPSTLKTLSSTPKDNSRLPERASPSHPTECNHITTPCRSRRRRHHCLRPLNSFHNTKVLLFTECAKNFLALLSLSLVLHFLFELKPAPAVYAIAASANPTVGDAT